MKLNLGCGPDVRPGWINIDMLSNSSPHYIQRNLLTDGLPVFQEEVTLIASTHFFEHLTDDAGLKLMKDCFNCLASGGKFRIALPDFRKIVEAYLRNDTNFFNLLVWDQFSKPETRSMIDVCTYGVYQFGEHLSIWDADKLMKVLTHIGFRDVKITGPDPEVDVMTDLRLRYSIYGEGVK